MNPLQFNDIANENGFCQEIDSICKSTATSYPLKQKARRLNAALDTYFEKSMLWCGKWSVGDTNNAANISSATTALKSGQQDYRLDQTMLVIESVWLKTGDGVYSELTPYRGTINTTVSGTPRYYLKKENSIVFDFVPNENGTIKTFFRRTLPRFSSVDTIKTSGLPSLHDFYLARLASLPYLIENQKNWAPSIATQITANEADIQGYYETRALDDKNKKASGMRPMVEDNR